MIALPAGPNVLRLLPPLVLTEEEMERGVAAIGAALRGGDALMERADAVELVRGLVAIPSLSRHEAEASAWLVDAMRRAGYERAFVDEAGNAVGEQGAGDAPLTFVLLGHIDTVPGAIPVRIESTGDGSVLYGRGSVDAKGPLATFVAAGARLGRHVGACRPACASSSSAPSRKRPRRARARATSPRASTACARRVPAACVIGEPSHWRRVTLGYKGRLLLDVHASQPMAHTAGPDASVADVDRRSLELGAAPPPRGSTRGATSRSISSARACAASTRRRARTSTSTPTRSSPGACPVGFDADGFRRELTEWVRAHVGAPTTMTLTFRGYEQAWRGDRNNALVRSFLAAIRSVDPAVQPGFVLKTGTSDMNVVAPIWKCPIVAYGPGDSALDHTPNEHLSLDEYWRAVQVVEAMLRQLAANPR